MIAAYVFRTSDGGATYVELAKLTASDATSYDYFGVSVAIDGDTIVVGAYEYDTSGTGKVYVFRTSDGGAHVCPGVQADRRRSVNATALASPWPSMETTIVVGSYYDDDDGTDSGSVYVFDACSWRRSAQPRRRRRTDELQIAEPDAMPGGGYARSAKLTAADGAAEYFGRSVAIDGAARHYCLPLRRAWCRATSADFPRDRQQRHVWWLPS